MTASACRPKLRSTLGCWSVQGLFGVGWGLGGYCPGPAVTALSLLAQGTLAFVPAMLAGLFIARFAGPRG
ncbi:MAG: DUF6691 family protein [Hyphomicrobium sp.]